MKKYFSLVKFSHTVFALPFALVGFMLAIHEPAQAFEWTSLLYVLLCMVFARNSAMGFNRYIDRFIDAENPRTAVREIPSGQIKATSALAFVVINAILFIATTALINKLCFYLSPIALLVVMGYSYTKRFTWLCHFILGLGLGLAPIGAYLAVTASFSPLPIILGAAVFLWTGGFDLIYALQDVQFDQKHELYSVPAKVGVPKALKISNGVHIGTAVLLILFVYESITQFHALNYTIVIGAMVFLVLLAYQHTMVKAHDLTKVNLAFFTTNGLASVIFGLSVFVDFYLI